MFFLFFLCFIFYLFCQAIGPEPVLIFDLCQSYIDDRTLRELLLRSFATATLTIKLAMLITKLWQSYFDDKTLSELWDSSL